VKDFTPIPDSIMRRRDLKFGAKCLLGRLKRYAYKSGQCYPSLPTLATELGTSLDSIRRFIAQLKKAGLIRVSEAGLGRGNSTNYVLCDSPEKVAAHPIKESPKGSRTPPLLVGATEIDHVTPLRDGGARLELSNLQPLCQRCHQRKTNREKRR